MSAFIDCIIVNLSLQNFPIGTLLACACSCEKVIENVLTLCPPEHLHLPVSEVCTGSTVTSHLYKIFQLWEHIHCQLWLCSHEPTEKYKQYLFRNYIFYWCQKMLTP